ncbi:MAG: FAD-dependent oxidoreductase [Myxococcota bacterium]|nr:FAD-dependent oxidoreductase [Myxococcota bacterium]
MAIPFPDRREQMFPTLTEAQIARIAKIGQPREVRSGEVLIERGDQNTTFFVVVRGALEIVRPVQDKEEQVTVHQPGGFTGEMNMLSARRSLVRCRVVADGSLVALDHDHLRTLVQRDSELSEIILRAFILRRVALAAQDNNDMILLGSRHSAATLRLKEFLSRNGQPFTYQDVETEPGVQALVDRFQISVNEIPVVLCESGYVLRNPTIQALASKLGLSPNLDPKTLRDVVIVGAGPAGLAAAVYAASEGLDVLVLESTAPGGQAGTSSRIENYLGFPTGISGQDLAERAQMQAEKFGADVAIARTAVRLECDQRPFSVHLSDGEVVHTKSIVVATGARYRRLALPELGRFEGAGVFYSATHLESQMCENEDVVVVGGGNSAGQAAVFLSQAAKRVYMLVRGKSLAESMSQYLIQRIENGPNVSLRTRTEIVRLEGADRLEGIRWQHVETGQEETHPIRNLFVMTGADPNTAWLDGCARLDDKKFVKTGADLQVDELTEAHWPLTRRPYLLESSIPGVFAVGDARAESVKRVAAAVGEGSICVQLIHRVLQEM